MDTNLQGKCQRFEKKGGNFLTPKVSVFMEVGVFFSRKMREKGSFSKQGTLICPPFLRQVRVPGGISRGGEYK